MDTSTYNQILDGLEKQLPKSSLRRLTVIICVAAFNSQELLSIIRVLRQLNMQLLDKREWSIVMFLNWPNGAKLDKSREIAELIRDISRLPLHIIEAELPKKTPIGVIRWLPCETVRRVAYKQSGASVYFQNVDVDTGWIARTHLQTVKMHLDEGAHAVVGGLQWDNRRLRTASVPVLALAGEMYHRLGVILSRYILRGDDVARQLVQSDAVGAAVLCNMAWPESYKVPHVELHEWPQLFRDIHTETAGKHIVFEHELCGVHVDSRRWLWAYHAVKHAPPHLQWKAKKFAEFTALGDKVRTSLPLLSNGKLTPERLRVMINLMVGSIHLPVKIAAAVFTELFLEFGVQLDKFSLELAPIAGKSGLVQVTAHIHDQTPFFTWANDRSAAQKAAR